MRRNYPTRNDIQTAIGEEQLTGTPARAISSRSQCAPSLSFGRHNGPAPDAARHAAVIVTLYRRDSDWYIPLTLRPKTIPLHPSQVSLPGGMLEAGETVEEAAVRELQEELGVRTDRVHLIGSLSPLYVFVSNIVVFPLIGILAGEPQFVPNPIEVDGVLEVPLRFLANPRNLTRHRITRGEMTFSVPQFCWHGHPIWGATCMVLGEFIVTWQKHLSGVHLLAFPQVLSEDGL